MVEPDQVVQAISLERRLDARRGLATPEGRRWFQVVEGKAPIIVTAPHSTRPLRAGRRRFSDGGGTAALAVALGEMTGAYVIYTTYEGPSDPNYYDDNAFRESLATLIEDAEPELVLDIHGSHPFRSYDVDLGTMDGKSLLGNEDLVYDLVDSLNDDGIRSISYNRFGASGNDTITKFCSRKGVPSIQLEINATYVTPSAGRIEAQRFSILLQALARFIDARLENVGPGS